MPKPKTNLPAGKAGKNTDNNEIKVKVRESSISEFVRRSLPTDAEVKKFDEYAHEEFRDENIEESLEEIYQSGNGDIVDINKLDIKKGKGFFFWFFSSLFTIIILGAAAYAFYFYQQSSSGGDIQFSIEGKDSLIAGEEFFYVVDYKNLSKATIKNIEIKLNYPENFIFQDSIPASESQNNDFWKIEDLESHRSGQIKIKGKIIGKKDSENIIWGNMTYKPINFSSEFKKEATFKSMISDTGINLKIESDSGVLVNSESKISVKYKAADKNYLNNFKLSIDSLEKMEFIKEGEDKEAGVWKVNEFKEAAEEELIVKFKILEKTKEEESLILKFEYSEDGEHYYTFKEEEIKFEVIKSDLNLNLIVNGARNDQGINFGETLNYTIVYANRGETEMKDVVIMAVLDSEILDRNSLKDDNKGKVGDNTIIWSKEEISALGSLKPNDEGTINFSIKTLPLSSVDLAPGNKYEVNSYAQFSIGNIEPKENEDTKSNTIINKINSDLSLDEQIRYYNDDDMVVGLGPLPPKVGETTSFKVYWVLSNNLHELENLRVEASLPDYVSWDNKNRAVAGNIYYNKDEHKVVWDIGRLPISAYHAEAEFSISIKPTADDLNKILILLPGSVIEALDSETNSIIAKTSKARTTKLEDDQVAREITESDGRVVR